MPWRRPENVPVGQVWLRFKGKERDGEPIRKYQIRDMEEKHRKVCLDLMQETFLRDEPLVIALGINSDPESVSSIRQNWEELVSQQMSLACFAEHDGEPDELVGFNVLLVKQRGEEDEDLEQIKGEPWKKLVKTLVSAEQLVDICSHYGVATYLSDSGLTVSGGHRGQNIGARILEAREPLCRAVGIEAISTVFTATPSQVLAQKVGYDLLGMLPYADMLKHGIDLTEVTPPYAELRGKRVSSVKSTLGRR